MPGVSGGKGTHQDNSPLTGQARGARGLDRVSNRLWRA